MFAAGYLRGQKPGTMMCAVCQSAIVLQAHAPLKKGTRLKLALHSVLVGSFRNLKDLLFGGCCCPITSQDMIVQCVIRRIACFLLLPLVQVPKPSDVDKGISQGPQQSCPADSWTNRFS